MQQIDPPTPSLRLSSSRWETAIIAASMLFSAVAALVIAVRGSVIDNGNRVYTLFDDAMISMRYADNFASGEGLTWNPGLPPVEGYTNFLWTIYMSVLHFLPVPDRALPLFIAITSAGFGVATIYFVVRLTRILSGSGSNFAAPIAAVLTASSYALLYWSARGMEVGFVALIVVVTIVLALEAPAAKGFDWRIPALLCVGLLVRPDMIILAAVVGAFLIARSDRRDRVRTTVLVFAPLALVLLLQTIFRVVYYDAILPNTYTLKVSHIPIDVRLDRGLTALVTSLLQGGLSFVALFAIVAIVDRRGSWRSLWLVPVAITAFAAYSVSVGGDAWESFGFANRYVSSVLPLLFSVSAVGIVAMLSTTQRFVKPVAIVSILLILASQIPLPKIDALDAPLYTVRWLLLGGLLIAGAALAARFRRKLLPIAFIVVGLIAVTSGNNWLDWARDGAHAQSHDEWSARYGLALSRYTSPDATIAVSSAGNIPYFAQGRTFIDELGKMEPHIAERSPNRVDFPPGHMKWDYSYSVGERRPDLVAQGFGLSSEDISNFKSWSYEQIGPDMFVRADSTAVNRDALTGWIRDNPKPK